jgi:prepilin-type N-terminal cleavage/methylation domain-containing protein
MTRRAFTLVELLVVIALISVLLALLMPALGGVWARLHELQCQHNLGQLAKCVLEYCTAWGGHFPYATDDADVGPNANSWLYVGSTTRHTTDFDITRGALWRFGYMRSPEILFCPMDERLRGREEAIDPPVTSYAINGAVTAYGQRPTVHDEFDTGDFLFIEENEEFSNFWDANIWPHPAGDWDSMTARHRGGGYVARMDAHVEWMDWEDMRDEMYNAKASALNRWEPDPR